MAQWWWKADYFETCNCAYGCPCNLTMIPTDGTCQAINFWRIREGRSGETRLDGLSIGLFSKWPNPIHKGNGKAVLFIDERANAAASSRQHPGVSRFAERSRRSSCRQGAH